MKAYWSFPFILALCTALPRTSLADKSAAVLLFDEAERLMTAQRMSEACPKFGESYRLDPQIGVLLHLADCQERIGKLASAWASFREAGDLAEKLGDPRAAEARGYAAALEPRLPRLTVTVSEAARVPGLEVRREGQPIGEPLWGSGVPVDPGEHQVEASAPGKKPWSGRVTVESEGQQVALEVPPLEAAPVPEDEAAPMMDPGTPVTADVGVPTAGAPLRTIGLVVGGVGVVGLGVGGYFVLRSKGLDDESKEDGHCNAQNECDRVGGAKRDDAFSAARIATVAFIAGGVLTATGVTLFLVGGPKKHTASVEAAPVAGQGVAGLTVRGAF
jgi:hypothetical protein